VIPDTIFVLHFRPDSLSSPARPMACSREGAAHPAARRARQGLYWLAGTGCLKVNGDGAGEASGTADTTSDDQKEAPEEGLQFTIS
jgi:hypothetical protein